MNASSINLLGLRVFISILGLIGNIFLFFSIVQNKISRVKSFELFLLGLAVANFEEIVVVDIYDIVILTPSSATTGTLTCRSLKFLTALGEAASIFFTVLISIFRYQKLRDADKRVNLPIFLDNLRSAGMASGVCVLLALLLSVPIYAVKVEKPVGNITGHHSVCPPDFFQCHSADCPLFNHVYKYFFIVMTILLPLIIVTATSCMIISVLMNQRMTVTPAVSVSASGQLGKKSKGAKFQRSTVAVLAAMALFQVDWSLYLIFQLTFSPEDLPFWAELEFLISTSYTSISPYVYGIGNNLFTLKSCTKK